MNSNRFSVLTYNIHKGFSPGNRRFVLHQIRTTLLATKADVLCLQEIQGEHQGHAQRINNWPSCSLEFLSKDTWPHYAYSQNVTHHNGHHGNAILSKFPLLTWENINVSPFSFASRSLLHGVIELSNKLPAIHVICLHFGLFGLERRKQITSLCERIDSDVPHDAPLIVAGDFNDWRGSAERRFYRHLNLQEAFQCLHGFQAQTFPVWLPMLPMDRIYFRGLNPLNCERLQHNPWPHLSDHLPLMAIFEL